MTDLVDQMFPPIHRRWVAEFTDSNYWKPPIGEFELPDFTPPSPALSARSDTSNQSALARLRNFSLGGRARSPPPSRLRNNDRTAADREQDARADAAVANAMAARGKDPHLRQMSSFERYSQALDFPNAEKQKPRSESPLSSATAIGSGDEEEKADVDWQGNKRTRQRGTSVSSMPGSLPGSDDDMDEFIPGDDEHGDEEGEESEYDEYHEDDEALEHNETFDEDLLAAGEMAQVPFL